MTIMNIFRGPFHKSCLAYNLSRNLTMMAPHENHGLNFGMKINDLPRCAVIQLPKKWGFFDHEQLSS